MFNWLSGRRPAVVKPVVKRAREVIAGLPDDDAAAAVNAITQALIAVNHSEVLTLDECYDDIQRQHLTVIDGHQGLGNGMHRCYGVIVRQTGNDLARPFDDRLHHRRSASTQPVKHAPLGSLSPAI